MIQSIVDLYKSRVGQLQPAYLDALGVFQAFYELPERAIWEAVFSNIVRHEEVLAQHFTRVSNEEMCGFQLLAYGSQFIEDSKFQNVVKNHAEDERRHAKIYRNLSDELLGIAPGIVEIQEIEPQQELGYGFDGNYQYLLLSIHMGEIRGLITLKFIINALSQQPGKKYDATVESLKTIAKDERWHIVYTGIAINEYLKENPALAADLLNYAQRYQAFWWQDVEYISKVFKNNIERRFVEYG